MPRAAEARAWWADVEDVRERIERRRARESEALQRGLSGGVGAVRAPATHRGVREVRAGRRLTVVRSGVPPRSAASARSGALLGLDGPTSMGSLAAWRRRPRAPLIQRLGPRPDRAAAWAVVLGFALLFAAILSAHG